jgi:nickel/cobalt transporter (NicO) family protein
MDQQTITLLLFSALSVGVIHTLLGPDHYLPFIVLAKTRSWSITKTITITTLCGIAHVLSAVVLGVAAISIGMTLSKLNFIESFRGEIAAWLLIGFGFAYLLWGVRTAIKNKKYIHSHANTNERTYIQPQEKSKKLVPWMLFIIFVLGPCEPLIPFIMLPAVEASVLNVFLVTLVFGLGTLTTMLFMVLVSAYGAKKLLNFPLLERYGNAMAGSIICGCGLAIKFLGL